MGKNKSNIGTKKNNQMKDNGKNPHQENKNINPFDEEDLKRIITEAIKDALQENLKRLDEDENCIKGQKNKKYSVKDKVWFWFRFFVFPFFLYKDKRIKRNAHDHVLLLVIELLLMTVGLVLWIFGPTLVVYSIIHKEVAAISVGLLIWMFGSLFITAAKSFDRENDSMKIYAYSASILALASFITSLWALFFATR